VERKRLLTDLLDGREEFEVSNRRHPIDDAAGDRSFLKGAG
jgi:hypothetical protein